MVPPMDSSALDLDRLAKVRALMSGGATEGERAAARKRAEAMACRAGLSLEAAMSKLDGQPRPEPVNFFAGFDDWMEEKEPGYKARKAAAKAKRDAREDRRRAEILAAYGTEAALFARNEREVRLDAAIAHIATWDHWTDEGGTVHRYAKSLDGIKGDFWRVDQITPAIRDAVMSAYPWPDTLAGMLGEMEEWDRLRWDRGLFCGGEWNHYREVECRIVLLEDALEKGQPAASWEDFQARFDWKRYAEERTWIDPTPRNDPFLDRLEADFQALRAGVATVNFDTTQPPTRRTNADKRAVVLAMLAAHPELADREIARRCGVSHQTVCNHRKARGPHGEPKE